MLFFSEKFKEFCRNLNIEQAASSSYHHGRNGQVETCIRFIKLALKKCFDSNVDTYVALLNIRSTSLGTGLPSPAKLLFNRPERGLLPVINRSPSNANNDDDHHDAVLKDKQRLIRTIILSEIIIMF